MQRTLQRSPSGASRCAGRPLSSGVLRSKLLVGEQVGVGLGGTGLGDRLRCARRGDGWSAVVGGRGAGVAHHGPHVARLCATACGWSSASARDPNASAGRVQAFEP